MLHCRELGLNAMVVMEQYSELGMLLGVARRLGVRPSLGIRAKLTTRHNGHWGSTSGDKAKVCVGVGWGVVGPGGLSFCWGRAKELGPAEAHPVTSVLMQTHRPAALSLPAPSTATPRAPHLVHMPAVWAARAGDCGVRQHARGGGYARLPQPAALPRRVAGAVQRGG